MNHKMGDKEILEKIVLRLNESGFNKKSISKISKEEFNQFYVKFIKNIII